MGRKILLITTDQQRWDALGCNGGTVARTPVVDKLAADGIRYERPYVQSTTCMPSRATILSGQYARTHGVTASGIPLPDDAPSIAQLLADHGYRTALFGKAHFEPAFAGDVKYAENRLVPDGSTGPYRGFHRAELATHGPLGSNHYNEWLRTEHPDAVAGFAPLFQATSDSDTAAPEVAYNPIRREHYHTDWVADRTISWLNSLDADDDWFCWLSFPDPHHPWDPPAAERHRVDWRDLELPAGYLAPGEARQVLGEKPAHWLGWYEGRLDNLDGACPPGLVPQALTADQIREISAIIHIENELIDEACGRVLDSIEARGWSEDLDVVFTSDHGEFQGDFGLLYKGPFHVDSLMRVPMIWRPAPSANIAPNVIAEPVGLVDVAATFCNIAGLDVPDAMQGKVLPIETSGTRARALCEWESTLDTGYRMRTIIRADAICTAYEPTMTDRVLDSRFISQMIGGEPATERVLYDGSEGELYRLDDDPYQYRNLWSDPSMMSLRDELVSELYEHLPPARAPMLAPEAIA